MSSEQELEFDAWLTDMDDALERFMELAPESLIEQLDYSPDSLNAIEHWLLQSYASLDAFDAEPSTQLIDGAVRYVGETFVRNLGAHWSVSLENPNDVFYGLPIVIGHPGQTTPLCPHRLTGVATDRRLGNFLRTVFDNQKR
jgi:hypothetical protein